MSRNIPRLRPGWASVICLAPMCCKVARTRMGSCLTPTHKAWVADATKPVVVCDFKRYGEACGVCNPQGRIS